jgi:hypothetical protein
MASSSEVMGPIVSSREQLPNIRLREILILIPNRFRHFDVFNARLVAKPGENGASQFIPGMCRSRSNIKNAVRR